MNKQSQSFFYRRRFASLFLLATLFFSFFLLRPLPVHAQTDFNQAINNILTPVWSFMKKAYEKGGAAAFQQAIRTALNKIAYDTATMIGSGREGQKALFVTMDWGDYLTQIGDEAAGSFIEDAVNNWNNNWDQDSTDAADATCMNTYEKCYYDCQDYNGDDTEKLNDCYSKCNNQYFSCRNKSTGGSTSTVVVGADGVKTAGRTAQSVAVCQPSSLNAKLTIALGLVDYNRPQAPNCTASELVANWDDAVNRLNIFKEKNFLDKFATIFNPVSNDLGIYMALRSDMTKKMAGEVSTGQLKLNTDKGWLDIRDIAGNPTGIPGSTEKKAEMAQQGYINNMAEFSGDALIDASNVFLNQLALTAFNKLMSNLGKKSVDNSNALTNADADPNVAYSNTAFQESVAKIIEPDFGVRADYNILVSLSVCRDRNNPGPTDCVLDNKLVQGITEKRTVAEALSSGYLHRDWLFTTDYRESSYNLRNLQIMRKYRLIPLGWEIAAAAGEQASLLDLVSCFSDSDEYNEYSSGFNVRNQDWCRGLIDPNWVLKAPQNYCAKQGYGAQIMTTIPIVDIDSNGLSRETVQISRAEDYCADEQTCVKEKEDGSCEVYGYCQAEKQTWKFDSPSCQPINNTCSSFTNAASGQKIAYLENTLDYGDCNADAAGCKRYSANGVYNIASGQVAWSGQPLDTIYFNSQLGSCSAIDEGCREMLRVKPTANLVMGANFANDNIGDVLVNSKINNYWPVWAKGNKAASIIDSADLGGASLGKVLLLESLGNSASSTISLFSDNASPLIPKNLNILSGETYTLSADVYLLEGDKVHAVLGSDYLAAAQTTDKNVWRHISITRNLQEKPLSELSFSLVAYSSTNRTRFAVRNVKLEMTAWDSGFSFYGAYKIYEKLIPPYLAAVCYINSNPSSPDYRLRDDAPAVCDNFARQCNREEAGCESYSEASTGFKVAAQAISSDYCDASCDGYNMYVSRASYFYAPQSEKIIPKNSASCSANNVGCSEFTNLDAVENGGENREYYSALKQCIKPGESCADFYTWVGTDESGYQLKALVLKKDNAGNPAVVSNDSSLCSAAIFNLPPSDPAFNPDCQQYYNKAGQISYHLSSATVTCSENCHSYRLSENNIDTTITAAAQCIGTDRFWKADLSACYVCQNGGLWSNQYQSCLYQAIPQEGKTCSADAAGCREYNGSLGNNTKLVDTYSFETGTDGWEGQCGDAALSSRVVSTNNGQSLLYDRGANANGTNHNTTCEQNSPITWLDHFLTGANAAPASYIRRFVGTSVQSGKAYSLKFTASAATAAQVSFAFLNGQDKMVYFNASESNPSGSFTVPGDNEWRTYELNLPELDHAVDNRESLIIVSNNDFYLDNLVISAINNRYYLIKNTSQVPDVCYYDMLDQYQGADYNLGCSLYQDRSFNSHYLRQFSRLCQDSAVGCELMIDTANYNDYKPGIWGDTNDNGNCDTGENDCVTVNGDRFFYAIYDKNKFCNNADLGCSRLGEASSAAAIDFSDVFKRNNPNVYGQALCSAGDAGCEAWQYTDGRGLSYFKNPGNNACVYRISTDPEKPGKAWYKVPVMRCDLSGNGKIDGTEKTGSICAVATDCADDKACLVDNNDYECAVSYLKTIGFGGSGNQLPVPSESAGLCEASSSGCSEYIDPVSAFSTNLIYRQVKTVIEPNKLYIFSVKTASSTIANDVTMDFDGGAVFTLQEDNNFSTIASSSLRIPANQPSKRFIFHSRGNNGVHVSGAGNGYEIVVQEAIVNYQLKQNLDKQSCNGIFNFDNGCVLFNERSMNGGQGLSSLSGGWNAAAGVDGQAPLVCSTGNCSANSLIKVRPDRVCSSWLSCLTYVTDPESGERTCFSLGECNRLNDNNECASFVSPDDSVISTSSEISKRDGYTVLNQYNLAKMKEVGLNTEAHFDFEASSPTLFCRQQGSTSGPCNFTKGITAESIIDSPKGAPTDYPAEGKAYLRVAAKEQISPHSSNSPILIQKNHDYYLNYLVNTKNSGLNAKVWVYTGSNPSSVVASATVAAPNGWERKILKIPAANLNNITTLYVYVGGDIVSGNSGAYVYFDDINIEPVLQINDNQYVAKECRLYPTQDATSCTSKNSQVVSDGLFGYCLQHDPANKDVCLMWYPIDKISASNQASRSVLGYQGAFPLNYCTEANGDFALVEKRIANKMWDKQTGNENAINFQTTFACSNNNSGITVSNTSECTCGTSTYCPAGYITVQQMDGGNHAGYCVPNLNLMLNSGVANQRVVTQRTIPGGNCSISYYEGWAKYDGLAKKDPTCDLAHSCVELNEATAADPSVRIFDYNHPTTDEEQLKLISSNDTDLVYYPTCNQFMQVVDSAGNNQAWAGRTSRESVYPQDTPTFFRDSSAYYGPSCYIPSTECITECECGIQCECGSTYEYCAAPCGQPGDCYAYGPNEPVDCSSTDPRKEQYPNAFNFERYGRNRELVPFGAATFPDDFNIFESEPIKFLNQYSKQIDQKIIAGRPYGCKGGSCNNIGHCSGNQNILCILDTSNSSSTSLINQRSCGSANGTCLPMWNGTKVADPQSGFSTVNIIRNIFLKDFADYKYSTSTLRYENINTSLTGVDPSVKCTDNKCHLTENDGNFQTYWHWIKPSITNIRLNGVRNNNGFRVFPGIYSLTFNTTIDLEQQPLKELTIDWGDGSLHTIIGQDNRPGISNPHQVYHYYKTASSSINIKIRVSDNWNKYCCVKNDGDCGPDASSCPGTN